MTWEALVEMEPRLAALADVAVSLEPDDDEDWSRRVTRPLRALVGWDACHPGEHPLASSAAYEVAYGHLLRLREGA